MTKLVAFPEGKEPTPDYWNLYQIFFIDNTKEEVLGKYVEYDDGYHLLFVYDAPKLSTGETREPLRIVPLEGVRQVKVMQVERFVNDAGESIYSPVNVVFNARKQPSQT